MVGFFISYLNIQNFLNNRKLHGRRYDTCETRPQTVTPVYFIYNLVKQYKQMKLQRIGNKWYYILLCSIFLISLHQGFSGG